MDLATVQDDLAIHGHAEGVLETDNLMEVSDQNVPDEADDWQVDITSKDASDNYNGAGAIVDNVRNDITWEKCHKLFNPELKMLIDEVISEVKLDQLSCFQEIFLHAIGSKRDVFAIASTGAGKTEATGIAAILLRKVFQEPQGLVIMFVPLTGIINELLENNTVATAAVSINGQIYGKDTDGGRINLNEDDILSGRFVRLVMHPESLKNTTIEKLLLMLKLKQSVVGVFIDEFHIIQPRHWASFRPGMEEQSARVRVFLRKGAPTGLLSATASQAEVDLAIESFGLKSRPVVLAESPVKKHFKFVVLKRPSDNYGFEGFTDQYKKFHAGLLHQLRVIYIDEYVRCIQNGEDPKHGILFFRTENQLILLLNYLRQTLGLSNAASAPFVSLVSSTPQVTEMVINRRKGSISLYLTTQKMLLGLNIPGLQICIFVKPMNMLHSIIQGAGRTGRPLPGMPDVRTRSLVYILANGGDLGAQVKGMSPEVKEFVDFKAGCLKAYLGKFFLGNFNEALCSSDWCCSFCSGQ
jgi:superfamily II DNA/RNA helicase